MCVCVLSSFSHVQFFATPWTVALQARILEWVAMPISRGSSRPRNQTHVSCICCTGRHFFTTSATWEALIICLKFPTCWGMTIHWKDWCWSWSWSFNTLATWCEKPAHEEDDPEAGKDWAQEEKGMTENEMVRWHHWLNELEFAQTPGDGERWESLACSSPWGCRVGRDWMNNNKNQGFPPVLMAKLINLSLKLPWCTQPAFVNPESRRGVIKGWFCWAWSLCTQTWPSHDPELEGCERLWGDKQLGPRRRKQSYCLFGKLNRIHGKKLLVTIPGLDAVILLGCSLTNLMGHCSFWKSKIDLEVSDWSLLLHGNLPFRTAKPWAHLIWPSLWSRWASIREPALAWPVVQETGPGLPLRGVEEDTPCVFK